VILITPELASPMDRNQAPKRVPGDESRPPSDHELFLGGKIEAANTACPTRPGQALRDAPSPVNTPAVTTAPAPVPEALKAPRHAVTKTATNSQPTTRATSTAKTTPAPTKKTPATPTLFGPTGFGSER
jgi:pilus assembly protein CpaC